MSEASLRFRVSDDDTAAALGSGTLPVLATPRLLAWLEAATCAALDPTLPAGYRLRGHPVSRSTPRPARSSRRSR